MENMPLDFFHFEMRRFEGRLSGLGFELHHFEVSEVSEVSDRVMLRHVERCRAYFNVLFPQGIPKLHNFNPCKCHPTVALIVLSSHPSPVSFLLSLMLRKLCMAAATILVTEVEVKS